MPFFGKYEARSKHLYELIQVRFYLDEIRALSGKTKVAEDEQRVDKNLRLVTTRIFNRPPSHLDRSSAKPNNVFHVGITPKGFFKMYPNSEAIDCFVEVEGQVRVETLIQPPPKLEDSTTIHARRSYKGRKAQDLESFEDESDFEFMIENVALPKNEQVQLRVIMIPRISRFGNDKDFLYDSAQITFVIYFYQDQARPPSLSVDEETRTAWSKGPNGIDLSSPKYQTPSGSHYPNPFSHPDERRGSRSNPYLDPYRPKYQDEINSERERGRGGVGGGVEGDRSRDIPLDPYSRPTDSGYPPTERFTDSYGYASSTTGYPHPNVPQDQQPLSRYSPASLPFSSAYPATSSTVGYGRSQIDLEMENQMMRAELKRERLLRQRSELRVELQTLRGLPPSVLPPSTSASLPIGTSYDQARAGSSYPHGSHAVADPYGYQGERVDRDRERMGQIEIERPRERDRYSRDQDRVRQRDSEFPRSSTGNYNSRVGDRISRASPTSPAADSRAFSREYSRGYSRERDPDPREYRHQGEMTKDKMRRDLKYSNSHRSSDPNDPISADSVNRITASRAWGAVQQSPPRAQRRNDLSSVKVEELEEDQALGHQQKTSDIAIAVKHSALDASLNEAENIQSQGSASQMQNALALLYSLTRSNNDQSAKRQNYAIDSEAQRDAKRSRLNEGEPDIEGSPSDIVTPPPKEEAAGFTAPAPVPTSFKLTEIQKLANLLSSAKSNSRGLLENFAAGSSVQNDSSQISTTSSNTEETNSSSTSTALPSLSDKHPRPSSFDSPYSYTTLNTNSGVNGSSSGAASQASLDPEKRSTAEERMRNLVLSITAKKKEEIDSSNGY